MAETRVSDLENEQAAEINGHTQSHVPAVTTLVPNGFEDKLSYAMSTTSVHGDDSLNLLTDVAPPLHVSTTFRYSSNPKELRPFRPETRPNAPLFPYMETPSEHCYSRLSTHSTARLEIILSSLLHNPCLTYSSGLSALHALLVHVCPKRVTIGNGYHGSHGVLGLHKRLSGLEVLDLDCAAEDLGEGDMILLETPINPTGRALDIAHYAEKAHSRGAYLMVDATFAPPPLQDPFVQGADVVMHSGTKYIGGHSDMLCGVLSIRKGLAEPEKEGGKEGWLSRMLLDREFLGSVMGGLEGWLGVRSVRTLELRVMRQSQSATHIVKTLNAAIDTKNETVADLTTDDVQVIRKVLHRIEHASLQQGDIDQGWLSKQMPGGFGPVFAISLKSAELARHLPSKLHLFHHATSLGGVESLIEWRTMSDATVGQDLLRLSIGVEDAGDLLHDIVQAFRALIKEFGL